MRDEGHKGAKYIGQQSIREGRCSEARAEGAVVTQDGTNPETGRPEGVRAPLSASTRVVILSCCWDPREACGFLKDASARPAASILLSGKLSSVAVPATTESAWPVFLGVCFKVVRVFYLFLRSAWLKALILYSKMCSDSKHLYHLKQLHQLRFIKPKEPKFLKQL